MIALQDFSQSKIIVVGDVMLDLYYWGEVSRISPEAPVPVVRIKNKTRTLGGAGNVALNLMGIQCQTYLLGIKGKDMAGQWLSSILERKNIPHLLVQDENHSTTTKTRIVGQGQQLLRLDEETLRALSEDARSKMLEHFEQILPNAGAVILSDYGKGVLLGDMAQAIIKPCIKRGIPVFVDPKGDQWQRYHGATCITPNLSEFLLFSGCTNADDVDEMERCARAVIEQLGLTYLMITKGPQGMSLFGRDVSPMHIPTEAREVFDVSGAGDTVIATLAAAYSLGISMSEAARLTNIAAGVVVGKLGTQPIQSIDLKSALWDKNNIGGKKICSSDEAQNIILNWRREGKKIVFTNGCFDILHIGHIKLLHTAASEGDKLVVGLNSDASVRGLKGESRPIMAEDERAALLASLKCVDLVVIFEESTPLALIEKFRPDILVKGKDYTPETVVGGDRVEGWGGKVVLAPLLKGVSTTKVIEQVKTR